jgi:hypothetical protein
MVGNMWQNDARETGHAGMVSGDDGSINLVHCHRNSSTVTVILHTPRHLAQLTL